MEHALKQDEEKILREGEHDLDEIYAKIEELATKKLGLLKSLKIA